MHFLLLLCLLAQEVSPTGKVTFTNAIEAVRKEAQKLKSDGVDIVIVLSHCGLDVDKQLADKAGDLFDVIVGAHSHSLLLNKIDNVQYDSKYDQIEGEYPIVVKKANNHKVSKAKASTLCTINSSVIPCPLVSDRY